VILVDNEDKWQSSWEFVAALVRIDRRWHEILELLEHLVVELELVVGRVVVVVVVDSAIVVLRHTWQTGQSVHHPMRLPPLPRANFHIVLVLCNPNDHFVWTRLFCFQWMDGWMDGIGFLIDWFFIVVVVVENIPGPPNKEGQEEDGKKGFSAERNVVLDVPNDDSKKEEDDDDVIV
jgi:hypothetical protein